VIKRAWRCPLLFHVGLLGLMLLALAFVADRPYISYTSDEGAGIIQAQVLRTTGGWVLKDTVGPLDPKSQARAIPLGDTSAKGREPYAKHPLYPLILVGADILIGTAGYVAVSMLGLLVAAVAAALIAGELDVALIRPTLWVVGLGSPLFLDGYLVVAQTLAAAFAGVATLGAIHVIRSRGARQVALLAGVVAAAALLVLVRSEGAIFDVALGLGLLACAVGPRRAAAARIRMVVAATAVLGTAGIARLAEVAARRHILGPSSTGAGIPGAPQGFLAARIDGARESLLRPILGADHSAILLVIGVIGCLGAGIAARRRMPPGMILLTGGVGVAGYLGWLVFGTPQAIPGLLIAWPVVGAALVCWPDRAAAADAEARPEPVARLLVVTAALFAGGVVATEYSIGGGVEWGGRFFAAGIPLAAPILAWFVVRVPAPQRSALLAVLGTAMTLLGVIAVDSLRTTHDNTRATFTAVAKCAAITGGTGSPVLDTRPLVVTDLQLFPQLDWANFDRYQWLAPLSVEPYVGALSQAKVARFVLLSPTVDADIAGSSYHVVATCRPGIVALSTR
jgi:hypothetical protein